MEAGFIAELEMELDTDEEAVLTVQQNANLARTANSSDVKLKEAKARVQEAPCINFGNVEISTHYRQQRMRVNTTSKDC